MLTYLRNFLLCVIFVLILAIGKIIYDRPHNRAQHPETSANSQSEPRTKHPAAEPARSSLPIGKDASPENEPTQAAALRARAADPSPGNPFVPKADSETFLITAEDATNRVAAEMFDVLADQPLLLVWLVDRTPSAEALRTAVTTRADQIYQQLAQLQSSRHPAFAGRERPLLTAVAAFAKELTWVAPEPTGDLSAAGQALLSITEDQGHEEHTFTAIKDAVDRYLKSARAERRRVMLVVVTDEVGDDQDRLDALAARLRKEPATVSVIGVAAPLGRSETLSPVVQIESWQKVQQGPESLESELIDLEYIGMSHGPDPIDSGFGPFALARLCKETGGRFWAVRHDANPARIGPAVSAIRFDPQVMARYAPDYVSRASYNALLDENRARRALVEAAKLPRVDVASSFKLEFVKKDEAGLKRALDEGQRVAARTEPKLRALYSALAPGEADRPRLTGRRWQAEFDLAMGRILAARARVEGYNAMLAQLKQGRSFPEPKQTTWVLRPAVTIQGDSNLEKLIAQARKYLERVVAEHPDTPWAMLAQRELQSSLGWEWTAR